MQEPRLESNAREVHLSPLVWGFSGYQNPKPRPQLLSSGVVIRLENDQYSILIYNNPAVADYHHPQDAVGISIGNLDNDEIRFGVSDGVSIVQQTMDNDSALLSHQLIQQLGDLPTTNWTTALENISQKFIASQKKGAATLVWGRIQRKGLGYQLSLLTVGQTYDLGMCQLVSHGNILNITCQSSHFIPYDFTIDQENLTLPDTYSLLITTDGALLKSSSVQELIQLEERKPPVEEVAEFLSRKIEPSKDDQSLILVSQSPGQ